MRPSRFPTLLAAFMIFLSLQTVTAQAQRVIGAWTSIYEGIEYAEGTDTSPRFMKAFVLRVDLWNPKVVLYASHDNGADPEEVTIETGLQFIADHGCKVAANASYGTPPPNNFYTDIWGLGISNGVLVSPAYTVWGPQYNCQLNISPDNVASIAQSSAEPLGIWTAVTGNAYHLVSGTALGAVETVAARTSFGLSQDKRYLIMMCVDAGRPGLSEGATILDMSNWMLSFGAYNAINMDGGGSTCMVRQDVGLVNRPNGGTWIRPVGIQLGVKTGSGVDNPPHLFNTDIEGWFPGSGVSAINYAPEPTWPGCMYFDQTANNGCVISPPVGFVGQASEVISVRLYAQAGTSASHNLRAFWRSDTDQTWNTGKASTTVSFTAQNGWATVNLPVSGSAWVGKNINRLRLYFDSTNRNTRWIVDSVSRAPATPPAVPTGVSATPATIHPGVSSTLSAAAGPGEVVEWFSGSCGGTAVPGGQSPTVSPTTTTTYYARAKNTTSEYVSACVPVTVTVRAYGFRIADLGNTPVPTNPITVWGNVTSTTPLKISDGKAEITVIGVTASVGDHLAVTGNWNGTVLTATEPARSY